MHGVEAKIIVAGDRGDHAQRLFAGHRVGVAGHGVHVDPYVLDQILKVVESFVVSIRHVAYEFRRHFQGLGEVAHGVDPACADQRVADHGVDAGKRLRVKMEGRHVGAWHFHAGFGPFRCGNNGGDGVEIPLHGHADDVVRVG